MSIIPRRRASRRRRASSRRRPATSPIPSGAYSAPPVFLFEPHQPEQCNFKPNVILNIDEVWEQKRKAFEILAAQKHLWDYYTRVALNRGMQGGRNSGKAMTYGEAYQRLFPMRWRCWHEPRRRRTHHARAARQHRADLAARRLHHA
jgi:LmbE family N-acetylglucosaminyl deacetylase